MTHQSIVTCVMLLLPLLPAAAAAADDDSIDAKLTFNTGCESIFHTLMYKTKTKKDEQNKSVYYAFC